MGFILNHGISFCITSGRAIFLDVPHDRYFCLAKPAERAFLNILDNVQVDVPDIELEALMGRDILRRVPNDHSPVPCPSLPEPCSSLLDREAPVFSPWQVAMALVELARTSSLLRRRGFAAALAAVAKVKATSTRSADPDRAATTVAASFAHASLVASAQDKCLARSMAVGRRLFRIGGQADLVLGVRLQPFRAHCWVQAGDVVVNDRPDVVRDFTPILIL